jgi:hypothetical protein
MDPSFITKVFPAFYLRESSVIVLQFYAKVVGHFSELLGGRDISVGITTGVGQRGFNSRPE